MIHFIVFSRNRPLQLHGFLTSLRAHMHGEAGVDVLTRYDPDYELAYEQLRSEFSDVRFFLQTDFSEDMRKLTAIPAEFICFGCDDVVFQRHIEIEDVADSLRDERIIGLSLRLGRHVTHGMFWQPQPQPQFSTMVGGRMLAWDMNTASGDWRYPWDVLGTIYRYDFVQRMWPKLRAARNPSQFEDAGSKTWQEVTDQHHYACWMESRTTVPTPNVVQEEFGNGYVGAGGDLDPAFLLACWNHSLRMDTERFDGKFQTWRIAEFHLKRYSA